MKTLDAMKKCKHDYVYKIMHDHRAADCCTKCGKIKYQAAASSSMIIVSGGPKEIGAALAMLAHL